MSNELNCFIEFSNGAKISVNKEIEKEVDNVINKLLDGNCKNKAKVEYLRPSTQSELPNAGNIKVTKRHGILSIDGAALSGIGASLLRDGAVDPNDNVTINQPFSRTEEFIPALTVNQLVSTSHETAKQKGWHDTPREDGTLLMLMVSELSEAMEELRNNQPPIYANDGSDLINVSDIDVIRALELKPEGTAIELVDCVIRIADYFGMKGWDLEAAIKLKMDYNNDRSYRHGGKRF